MADPPHMPDPHPYPHTDSDGDTGVRLDRESTTSTPRWMTALGIIIAILLVLAFVVLHLTGALGPGLHS